MLQLPTPTTYPHVAGCSKVVCLGWHCIFVRWDCKQVCLLLLSRLEDRNQLHIWTWACFARESPTICFNTVLFRRCMHRMLQRGCLLASVLRRLNQIRRNVSSQGVFQSCKHFCRTETACAWKTCMSGPTEQLLCP